MKNIEYLGLIKRQQPVLGLQVAQIHPLYPNTQTQGY